MCPNYSFTYGCWCVGCKHYDEQSIQECVFNQDKYEPKKEEEAQ